MKLIDLLHRWLGGILGLVLAVLGLTGAILVHKEDWIALPHAGDARVADPQALGSLADKLLAGAKGGESVIFASDRFGLVQLRKGEGGLYASQTGETVAAWSSQWERPELWLFDLHHRLFTGDTGQTVVGLAGLAAIGFVATGAILWWRTRHTFRLRFWPARMTGPAIRMHHRDIGIVFAPLLFLTALTGTMMVFRPVTGLVLAPFGSPAKIEADLKAPKFKAGALAPDLDWSAVVTTAHRTFPDAQIRIIALPRRPGDPVTVRMKREAEWLPNGRSMVWFDPASGKLLASRDAMAMELGTRLFNMAYPVHAGKIGRLAYRLVLTLVGAVLTLLGTLAVWSFWFRRPSSASA